MSLGGKPRSGGQGLGLERGGGGGGRVSSRRGRQPRRHSAIGAVGAVATAAAGARRGLLPPFKRELECEAAALDEAKEVVAPPQLGRSQDLVEEQGGVVPPTPPSHRPCRPMHRPLSLHRARLSARARGWLGCRRAEFGEGLQSGCTACCAAPHRALSAVGVCAWNAACSSLVRRRASPRRSGWLYVTRCQCRIAASYASWTCEHMARI